MIACRNGSWIIWFSGNSGLLIFCFFRFLNKAFQVLSSDGGQWADNSQRPGKTLKNWKSNSFLELP
jgi:hypothetical protein